MCCLVLLDGVAGMFAIPFGNFLLRTQLLWQALHRWWANHAGRKGRTLETAVSITAALLLGGAACATLAGADDNFARLWGHLGSWLGQLFGQDALLANLLIFALSLPVGAWLFGLAGGSARRKAPPVAAEQFYGKLAALPRLQDAMAGLDTPHLAELAVNIRTYPELADLLQRAIIDNPPAVIRDGGVIAPGYDASLDELRSLAAGATDYLQQLELRERERTGISTLKVDGGASRDQFLMQFQADILNKTVLRPAIRETTALGAAYLAGLATGVWKDRDEIRSLWHCNMTFAPQMDEAERTRLLSGWHKAVGRSCDWAEH